MKRLDISSDLKLPLEAVTQTFGILAVRGVGKTFTAKTMCEEMLKAGLPVVVIDPVGVWWGLRSSSDGKKAGLPIIIFGGEHGDVPLEIGSGELIANLIVKERISAVIDLSLFRKGEQVRWMTDFCERLYHKNRDPLHVFLDEADFACPQKPMKGNERLLGAVEDLVRRGRARGLGITLITQRAAVINKNVLTQISVLVALRTVSPQDRAAIDAWIQVHGTDEEREELMESLASLPIGTAWFWSPGWLNIFKKVKIRMIETFDSSATPKVGQKIQAPKKLAEIDLGKIREQMAQTIEKAKNEDPKALKKEVERLKKELSYKKAEPDPYTVSTEVKKAVDKVSSQFKTNEKLYQQVIERLKSRLFKIAALAGINDEKFPEIVMPEMPKINGYDVPTKSISTATVKVGNPTVTSKKVPMTYTGSEMNGGERRILSALAQYPGGRTKNQIAILTSYSHKGGGFNNNMSSLRTKGFIEGYGENIKITELGFNALGDYDPLPTGKDLFEHWKSQLSKAERTILDALGEAYPDSLTKEEVGEATGYEPGGGGFNNALSKLRTLELIEGRGSMKLSDSLV